MRSGKHQRGSAPRLAASSALIAIALALFGCASATSDRSSAAVTSPSASAFQAADRGRPCSGGPAAPSITGEGTLTTSGAYPGTWRWSPSRGDAEVDAPTRIDGLISDAGACAIVRVTLDGKVFFNGDAPGLATAQYFTGPAGDVTLTKISPPGVCSFTIDGDVIGVDKSVLHLKGSLTIHDARDPSAAC